MIAGVLVHKYVQCEKIADIFAWNKYYLDPFTSKFVDFFLTAWPVTKNSKI